MPIQKSSVFSRELNFLSCRSSKGSSIHPWLIESGSVYVRRNARYSRFVDEVGSININPHYAPRDKTLSFRQKSPESKLSVHEPESHIHGRTGPAQELLCKFVEPKIHVN